MFYSSTFYDTWILNSFLLFDNDLKVDGYLPGSIAWPVKTDIWKANLLFADELFPLLQVQRLVVHFCLFV